jgi:hypothetical protein
LSKYHLENFFLDENVLAKVFEPLEPEGSWLQTPSAVRQELRSLATGLVSYTVALLVSREFRLRVGNVDLMPKGCNGKSEAEIIVQLVQVAEDEKHRVNVGLDKNNLSATASKYFKELNLYLSNDDPRWKDMIPGKPLLAQFASKAKIDSARLKNAYIHCAENLNPSPFKEIHDIFDGFARA